MYGTIFRFKISNDHEKYINLALPFDLMNTTHKLHYLTKRMRNMGEISDIVSKYLSLLFCERDKL